MCACANRFSLANMEHKFTENFDMSPKNLNIDDRHPIKRGVSPLICSNKDKEELLEVYYKHACPMPQRKYRMNRRGRVMTKSQITIAKRKRTYQQMSESDQPQGRSYTVAVSAGNQDKPGQVMPKSGLINQFNLPMSGKERLKPPPIVLDPNKKVVKLSSNNRNIASEAPSTGERKKITFNRDPNKPETKSSDLSNVVINTEIKKDRPKSTGLEHVVINSNIKKSNGNKTVCNSSSSSKSLVEREELENSQQMDIGSQMLLSQEPLASTTKQKATVKIRLKRPVDIKIPSTEEILTQAGDISSCVSSMNTNGSSSTQEIEIVEVVAPHKSKHNPCVISPKQRQLNLINRTLKQGAKVEQEKVQKHKEETEQQSDDEEVVTKKFKRVAIGWP